MGAVRQMTGLAGRCRCIGRQVAILFGEPAFTVFGGRPHLPLGMIVAHVALLTGSGALGLFFGEGMTGMAFVTGVVLVAIAFFQLFFFLLLALDPHVMTTAAAAAAFDQFIRGHVGGRDGVQ